MPADPRLLIRLPVLLFVAVPLTAQTVTGTVLLPDSATPAARVLVELQVGGRSPMRVLTDARGSFAIRFDGADSVRLRALRPGLRPTLPPPFFVGDDETRDVRIVLNTDRVTLAPVTVVEDRVCGVRADAAAWQLWDEARTVLHSTVLAEQDSLIQMRTLEYQGVAQPDGTIMIADTTLRLVPIDAELGAAHYDSLFRFGYIRRNTPGVTTYYAPNASVLADERFALTHCFRFAAEDTVADDLVGVRFEPLSRPRDTEVAGTLWLDVETYRLRRIDFIYINPPLRHRTAGTGGSVEFLRIGSGHWIMREWTIRMANPLAGTVEASEPGSALHPAVADFGLWARRQVVFQVTEGENLLYRDAPADSLARTVRRPRVP